MGKTPLAPHLVELAALTNLGPVSARWLYDAGIETPDALREVGALGAFRRIALHRGGDVTLNLLYALDGALRSERWDHLPVQVRNKLKAMLDSGAE